MSLNSRLKFSFVLVSTLNLIYKAKIPLSLPSENIIPSLIRRAFLFHILFLGCACRVGWMQRTSTLPECSSKLEALSEENWTNVKEKKSAKQEKEKKGKLFFHPRRTFFSFIIFLWAWLFTNFPFRRFSFALLIKINSPHTPTLILCCRWCFSSLLPSKEKNLNGGKSELGGKFVQFSF